ncbi:hypothetical protein HK096_000961, partial [Nowakowskiella sp. JEL0078]
SKELVESENRRASIISNATNQNLTFLATPQISQPIQNSQVILKNTAPIASGELPIVNVSDMANKVISSTTDFFGSLFKEAKTIGESAVETVDGLVESVFKENKAPVTTQTKTTPYAENVLQSQLPTKSLGLPIAIPSTTSTGNNSQSSSWNPKNQVILSPVAEFHQTSSQMSSLTTNSDDFDVIRPRDIQLVGDEEYEIQLALALSISEVEAENEFEKELEAIRQLEEIDLIDINSEVIASPAIKVEFGEFQIAEVSLIANVDADEQILGVRSQNSIDNEKKIAETQSFVEISLSLKDEKTTKAS